MEWIHLDVFNYSVREITAAQGTINMEDCELIIEYYKYISNRSVSKNHPVGARSDHRCV